jgi:uncharacterized protein YvpB
MRAWIILMIFVGLAGGVSASEKDFRGVQFIGFTEFSGFERELSEGKWTLISPKIETQIEWEELIVSWNFDAATNASVVIEAQATYPERPTGWYCLGKWGAEARESVRGQDDKDGRVDTDTLKLKKRAKGVWVRLTLRGEKDISGLKFVGLSFCDRAAERVALEPNRKVWGKSLVVKERSQVGYPEGISEWCSPTSTSMLLSYWAKKVNRPELDHDVPEVARAVNDPNWPGTGNWPFNMAFAGAHEGMRAYVARFSDVSELEDWIEAGVPVAVSVAYGFLKGQEERAKGHLVVCIGFDESGNVIVNDPGRSTVRQVYARDNLIKAWAESENTVYLVYPEKWKVPVDRFGHWLKD